MKKLIVSIVLLTSSIAFAGGLDSRNLDRAGFNDLSEVEKAEIIQAVAQKASQKEAPLAAAALTSPEKVDQYITVGANLGKALGGAAKELGLAVNDFAKTPVGTLITGLVIWKFFGVQIIHLVTGLIVWVVGFAVLRYLMNRRNPRKIRYSETKKTFWGGRAIEEISTSGMSGDEAFVWTIAHALVFTVGLITILTF